MIIDKADDYKRIHQFVHRGLYKAKFSNDELNSIGFCKAIERGNEFLVKCLESCSF